VLSSKTSNIGSPDMSFTDISDPTRESVTEKSSPTFPSTLKTVDPVRFVFALTCSLALGPERPIPTFPLYIPEATLVVPYIIKSGTIEDSAVSNRPPGFPA